MHFQILDKIFFQGLMLVHRGKVFKQRFIHKKFAKGFFMVNASKDFMPHGRLLPDHHTNQRPRKRNAADWKQTSGISHLGLVNGVWWEKSVWPH